MNTQHLKRIVNTAVSIPVIIIVACGLIIGSAFLAHWMDFFEPVIPVGIIGNIKAIFVLVICAILCCAMFVASVFIVSVYLINFIISGDGLIWRRVDKGDFLKNSDGSIFLEFTKVDFIWRRDPIFSRRKLVCSDGF